MEPSTQKLIHTFGALADLGQEIAGTGDFTEMVRTSLHLLLGTLALRRGAVAECMDAGSWSCVAVWGLGDGVLREFAVDDSNKEEMLAAQERDCLVRESNLRFIARNRNGLVQEGIE